MGTRWPSQNCQRRAVEHRPRRSFRARRV